MGKPLRIPIFPLEVVLFPGMSLPLHIFEPRYKEMTRRCLNEHLEFGVVLAHSEGIASVGCTAQIGSVVREYPDGRLDVLTAGHSIFSIQEVHEEKPYLEANVEYRLDDPTPGPPELQAELQKLVNLAQKVVRTEGQARLELDSDVSLSFQILALLPLDLKLKQEFLEMGSEIERRQKLRRHLKSWLPQLGRADRVRRKAHGNGHGLS